MMTDRVDYHHLHLSVDIRELMLEVGFRLPWQVVVGAMSRSGNDDLSTEEVDRSRVLILSTARPFVFYIGHLTRD